MQKLPPAPRAGRGAGGRGRSRRRGSAPEVYAVTTARTGQHDDVGKRARNYMISMTIRLVCLVLAFVFFGTWEAWVFAAGAVVLPYVAVVMANSGRERAAAPPTAMMSPQTSGPGAGAPQAPAPVRSIGAVPARTTPAPDPWADPRTAPRPTGGQRRPGGPDTSWQHSYAPPAERTAHTARAS